MCVPFGGGNHDWAALEVGARSDVRRGRRDASRLLADAALSVQRVVGVDAEPQLIDADADSLVAAGDSATIVVTGLSPTWRRQGLGEARRALIRSRRPTLLLHRGPAAAERTCATCSSKCRHGSIHRAKASPR